ncbi:MAG: hypothetical protein ACR2JY_18525 [Chloroflexota bacterium]
MADDPAHPRHENAVSLWRAGEKLAHRRQADDWQRDYDAAIAAAVVMLHRYHTLDALITAYFDDAVDDALEPLCRLPSGRVLNFAIVEDAAYWRRLQQLVGEQAGRP